MVHRKYKRTGEALNKSVGRLMNAEWFTGGPRSALEISEYGVTRKEHAKKRPISR